MKNFRNHDLLAKTLPRCLSVMPFFSDVVTTGTPRTYFGYEMCFNLEK
jgi:hypothetical protein